MLARLALARPPTRRLLAPAVWWWAGTGAKGNAGAHTANRARTTSASNNNRAPATSASARNRTGTAHRTRTAAGAPALCPLQILGNTV